MKLNFKINGSNLWAIQTMDSNDIQINSYAFDKSKIIFHASNFNDSERPTKLSFVTPLFNATVSEETDSLYLNGISSTVTNVYRALIGF